MPSPSMIASVAGFLYVATAVAFYSWAYLKAPIIGEEPNDQRYYVS